MDQIPNAKDLPNAQNTSNFQSDAWKKVIDVVNYNFQLKTPYLGYGPTNCINIYTLNSGDVESANNCMKLFQSMFASKGYNVMASHDFEVLNVGMSPIVRDRKFTFSVCPCASGKN